MQDNPYRAPARYSSLDTYSAASLAQPSRSLGGFVLTMVLIDTVLCVGRLCLLPVAVLGVMSLSQHHPLTPTIPFEVGTSSAIVLCGIVANALLLTKKSAGVPIATASILFTIASLGIAVWQASLTFERTAGGAEAVGFVIGLSAVLVVRVTLLSLYAVAVRLASNRFAAWEAMQQ